MFAGTSEQDIIEMKHTPETPITKNGLVQMIRMDNLTDQKMG